MQAIPTIEMPDELSSEQELKKTFIRIWEERVDDFSKIMVTLDNNRALAYSHVWGQGPKIMRGEVEAKENLTEVIDGLEIFSLLKFINEVF